MNNTVSNLLNQLLQNNPNIQNNPQAQAMISAIQNNDQAKGEEIANNLLKTYGVSKDDALNRARKFFNL